MKYVAVIVIAVSAVIFASYGFSQATRNDCSIHHVKGYVSVRDTPPYLVGTIPNYYTSNTRYFHSSYNCTKKDIQIRRVDLGTYDISFSGLNHRAAVVTAISQDGVFASVFPFINRYRVILRGPVSRAEVAIRRDVPFTIVVL